MTSSHQDSPKVSERAVQAGDLHNALVYARAHLRTHMDWQAYLNQGGELPHDLIGDLEHQKQAINELNTICKVLRRFSAEPHIPVSALLSDEFLGYIANELELAGWQLPADGGKTRDALLVAVTKAIEHVGGGQG